MSDELPTLPDATVEAVIRAASQGVRGCEYAPGQHCWGTHTDCYYRGLLGAARDPALGQDRLVLSRELDEAMQVLDEVTAESCRLGSAGGLMQVERDEALAEVARLRAARPMGGADA